MKIRSLSFLNRGDVQKLRDVADMEVSEYIAWIKEREDKNVRINKPYRKLYEKIKQNMPMIMAAQKAVPAIQPAKEPKQMMLEPFKNWIIYRFSNRVKHDLLYDFINQAADTFLDRFLENNNN